MKVLDLCCSHGHRFEGWFASDADYQGQIASGLLICPMCSDPVIERLPSAPRLNMSRARPGAEEAAAAAQGAGGLPALAAGANRPPVDPASEPGRAMQQLWQQAVRFVIANTEDVGDRFAEEARRIHHGEADERAIRGQATREEAVALQDEGIEIEMLPLPPGRDGPLQ